MKRSCRNGLSLFVFCFSFLVFSSSAFALVKDLKKRSKYQPAHAQNFFTFETFLNLERDPFDSFSSVLDKAKRIYSVLSPMVENDVISLQKMYFLVLFIEEHQKLFKSLLLSRHSLYIHPYGTNYPVALQIYQDGTIYLHLGELDKSKREGSYKKFSRSIHYQSEEVVANLVSRDEKVGSSLTRLLNEIGFMEELQGKGSFIHFYHGDLYTDFSNSNKFSLKLIFQAPLYHGDLEHLPMEESSEASLKTLVSVFYQSAKSLNALHKLGYIHRDIKPENIFYKKSPNLTVILGDFGFIEDVNDRKFGMSLSGSRGYVAPEVFLRRVSGNFTFESTAEGISNDTYAMGLSFGKLFFNLNEYPVFKLNQRLNYLGWPKSDALSSTEKPKESELEDIQASLQELKSAHTRMFPRIISDRNNVVGFIKSGLEVLIWKMTCPQFNNRLSLDVALEHLEAIHTFSEAYL